MGFECFRVEDEFVVRGDAEMLSPPGGITYSYVIMFSVLRFPSSSPHSHLYHPQLGPLISRHECWKYAYINEFFVRS